MRYKKDHPSKIGKAVNWGITGGRAYWDPVRPRGRPTGSRPPLRPETRGGHDGGRPVRPRGRPTGSPRGPRGGSTPRVPRGPQGGFLTPRGGPAILPDRLKPRSGSLAHLPRGWKGPPLSREDYRKHQNKQVQKQLQGVPKSSSGPMDRDRVPQGGPRVSPPRGRPMGPPRGRPAGPPRGRPGYDVGVHDALDGPLKAGPRSSPRPYQGNRKSGGEVSAKKYSMNRGGKVASVRKPTRA